MLAKGKPCRWGEYPTYQRDRPIANVAHNLSLDIRPRLQLAETIADSQGRLDIAFCHSVEADTTLLFGGRVALMADSVTTLGLATWHPWLVIIREPHLGVLLTRLVGLAAFLCYGSLDL